MAVVLLDTQPGKRTFRTVPLEEVREWTALGWIQHWAREGGQVLIEWQGSEKPRTPKGAEA